MTDFIKEHAPCDFATFKGSVVINNPPDSCREPAMACLREKGCNHFIERNSVEHDRTRIDGYILHGG